MDSNNVFLVAQSQTVYSSVFQSTTKIKNRRMDPADTDRDRREGRGEGKEGVPGLTLILYAAAQ